MLGLPGRSALWISPVPIALAKHDRIVQVVLEPRDVFGELVRELTSYRSAADSLGLRMLSLQ